MLWMIAVAVVVGFILIFGIKNCLLGMAGYGLMLDELWKKRTGIEKLIILVGAIVVWPIGLVGLLLWLVGRSFMRQLDRELDRMYAPPTRTNQPQPAVAGEAKAPDSKPPGEGGSQGVEGKADE